MNALLHALAALLLWRLAAILGLPGGWLAAAVFALHPVHVESVAWITERKDVLSLLFWLLALLAYQRWAAGPTRGRWALVVLAFAGGLLSKPSVITLPLVLLLLDRWPLRRTEGGRELVREKWMLFALSAASAAVTVAANRHGGLVESAALPLRLRVLNAIDAYVLYLRDAVWPAALAVGHPHHGQAMTPGRLAFCVVLLAALTALAASQRRRRPYLLVGWSWFVVTLVPMIGLTQSGLQGRADRFVYIPLLGLGLAAGLLLASWARGRPLRVAAAGAAAVAALAALTTVTRAQVRTWRDDFTLFSRAAAVEPRSPIAASGLASTLASRGDLDGAEREMRRALALDPDSPGLMRNLAALLMRRGQVDEAAALAEQALATWAGPGSWARPETLFTLALVRSRQARAGEALGLYDEVARLQPRHWAAHYNAGNLLAAAGRLPEAAARYGQALRGNRDNVDAWRNLGLALLLTGRPQEAEACFRAGLRIDPGHGELHTGLGRALAAGGRTQDALAALREGVRLWPASGEAHFQLADHLRAQGAAPEAQAHYREALRLDPTDTRAREALAR
ncbi:MAG TPA: tetratricopeptide repeat protein [Vicinamibacteria bacterium]|nr:tetratricopeptide repeat protein [Vicinamibacteria bacterium]